MFAWKPTLQGIRCVLRPFSPDDLPVLGAILADPEVVLNELRDEDDSCSFRILVGPRGRGRGIGSEATRLMLDYAFSATTLNRIELEVFGFNPRARHVYAKAGFVLEGWKRDALKFDGGYVDSAVMAVLRADWDAIHRPRV